tara:strand:+ start:130 stop:378 length:249 start_codon:yes stop_codon:yes gene_type:complete
MSNTITILGFEREYLSKTKACQLGFRPFTFGYEPRSEAWMIERCAADLDRAKRDWVIVYANDPHHKNAQLVEIWVRDYCKPS